MNLLGQIPSYIDYITMAFPITSKTSGRELIRLPTSKTSSIKRNVLIIITGNAWMKRKSPTQDNRALQSKSHLPRLPPALSNQIRIKGPPHHPPLHPLPHSLVLPLLPNPNPLLRLLRNPLLTTGIFPLSLVPMANSFLKRKPVAKDLVSAAIAAKIIHLHAYLSPNQKRARLPTILQHLRCPPPSQTATRPALKPRAVLLTSLTRSPKNPTMVLPPTSNYSLFGMPAQPNLPKARLSTMVLDSYDLFLLDLNISNPSVTALVTLIPFPLIRFPNPLRLHCF